MHVSIVAYGTWGDVHPSIALGLALKDAGYSVRLSVTEDFAEWVKGLGVDIHILPVNKFDVLKPDSFTTNPLQMRFEIHQAIISALHKIGRDLVSMAEDTEVLFVNEWLLGVASRIAEAHQLKLINIAMQPRIKTRQTQIAIMPAWPSWAPFRETYNVLTYDLMSYFKWFSHARPVNSRLKTDPRLNSLSARDYVALFDRTPSLTLISRHVMPRPSDWAEHHHLTGYLFYDDAGWRPPAELVNFIQSGDAPIYIGFGSIQDRRPDETTRLILSALKKTRQRAVLLSGWSELGQIDLPETVYRLDYAPHSWLFPRVKAVVHHAGAGTTAAALRAGIPSVTIPHSGDQPFWARRLYQLGAGTVPLPRYRLNSVNLADRIIKALEDEQMRSRAEELGKKIGDENSVSKTIAVINDLL